MLRGRSFRVKVLAAAASVSVVAAGVIGYQLTNKNPPSFRRGGEFAVAGPSSTSTTTLAAPEATTTSSAATPGQPATTATSAASTTTASARRRRGPASSTTVMSGPARTTPTTRAASGPAPTAAPAPAPTSPTPSTAPSQPGAPGKPALGTYTWTVDGTERAPFVGSRRYPETMTMVVHARGGVQPDQLVFDLTYSENHAEREIVGFRSDGIYFDFEGGSITFGPRTETSQADYAPPILQIPFPLQPGLSRSGVTEAKGADGGVSRTEDWKTTVVGREPVTVDGATVNAWKIEVRRTFRPGSADQGYRNRTYWFDPARHLWVKYTEVFHGERRTAGFSFSYDSSLTAVLSGYTP